MMKKSNFTIQELTTTAVSIALVCVGTIVIQIPIPLGYMHLGNICILLVAYLFSPTTALLAGGVGSAMADLITGYPQWILPTLIIKSLMGLAAAKMMHSKNEQASILSIRGLLGSLAGIFIMIMGYFIAGSVIYGNIYTGAAQIPGLSIEGICGIVGYYIIGIAMEKMKISKLIRRA
ncbi:MAG: ECF transporter S component [Clostridia bacterium]|nr:ECF transporter S component [Clostridia bacterium]